MTTTAPSSSPSVVKRLFKSGLKSVGGAILVVAAVGLLCVAVAIVMIVAAFLIVGLAGFMLAMPDKSQRTVRLLAHSIQTGTKTLKQLVEEAGAFYLKLVASFQGATNDKGEMGADANSQAAMREKATHGPSAHVKPTEPPTDTTATQSTPVPQDTNAS